MSRRAVVVAVVVVLAGCGAVPFGDQSPREPTDTLTPVPAGEFEPTATQGGANVTDAELPPGVSANGSVRITLLERAHRRVISNTTYTWTATIDRAGVDTGNGTLRITRAVAVDENAFLIRQDNSQGSIERTIFVDETGQYLRYVGPNETRHERIPGPGEDWDGLFGNGMLHRYLIGLTFDVTAVERGGETYYRLYSGDGERPPGMSSRRSTVANYTATAYVTPDGLVRTLAVEFDRRGVGGVVHASYRFDYTAVGQTSVTRPDWLSQATPTPSGTPPGTAANDTDATTPDGDGTATASAPADGTSSNGTATDRTRTAESTTDESG